MSGLHAIVLFLCAVLGVSQCAADEFTCPTFWTAWGDHCYRYFGYEVSWEEAANTCRLFSAGEGRGFADLVSVHSQDEHDFIYSWWRSLRQDDNRHRKPGMWIGLTDYDVNGAYVWADGTDVDYTNFDDNQETANEYRWFLADWVDGSYQPKGKWHDVDDKPDWYFQFMCKMSRA